MSAEFLAQGGKTYNWSEMPPLEAMSMTYDDVEIAPQVSLIESRGQISTDVDFGPYHLKVPVVAAPMDTVTGREMIIALHQLGGMGTLPRAKTWEEKQENLALCETFSKLDIPCLYAVGLKPNSRENIKDGFEEAKLLKKCGAQMILIDVAHGGMEQVKRTAMEIKSKLGLTIVAGNIATYNEAEWYKQNGIDIARVGVGGGGVCSTRIVTGVGVPQFSAVLDTVSSGIYVIADGGIRYSGDVAKAIAAGAKMCMIGSKFGSTTEAPGERIEKEGKLYKVVRGQASRGYMRDSGTSVTDSRAAEGVEKLVVIEGSVKDVVHEIRGGLVSAMSYSNGRTIEEFQNNAQFVKVGRAAQREAHPHLGM